MKKIYSTGHVKKKIGYFQTLGGGGGVSDKVGKFQFFLTLPLGKGSKKIKKNKWEFSH